MSRAAATSTPDANVATRVGGGRGELTHRQILTILSGLMLGMFLAALDQTIVSTAIRTIADDLHGLNLQAWATTAYLITSTVSTPLYGKLSDIYGRKPFFLTAITIFLIGSIACTFSTSMYELAAFRAFQGLGAGGLMSLALAIIGDIVPPRERAKYQGYFLAVFGTSSVLGPVIGGFFAGTHQILTLDGWRWVFLVNVPIGLIALFVVARVLNIPHTRKIHRIDWGGALTISIGLIPLLIVAERGQEWGWKSQNSLLCYGIGAVGIIAFILVEYWMKDEALIPLRLFKNSVFSLTSLGGVLVGMAMFGAIAMIPQYLQIVRGATPTSSGLQMLPFMGGLMVASIVSGQITSRTGRYKIFPLLGTLFMVGAALLFHYRVNVDTPRWETITYMVLFGLGLGQCMQTLTLAVQNAAPPRDMGVASSSSTFFRQMGGTLGTAVFLSVLFSTVGDKIKNAFQAIAPTPDFQAALHDPAVLSNPVNKPVLDLLQHGGAAGGTGGVLQDSSFLQHIDPRLARPFLVGFSDSMALVFFGAAIVAAAAFVVLLFMKEIPLRNQSGLQAMAAAEGGETAVDAAADVDHLNGLPALTDGEAPTTQFEPIKGYDEPNGGSTNGKHRVSDDGGLPVEAPVGAAALAAEAGGSALTNGLPDGLADGSVDGGGELALARPLAPVGAGSSVRGYVRRADGSGVGRASLTLIDLAGHQVGRGHTGSDGGYKIDAPKPGSYVLIASAGSHQPQASMVEVGSSPTVLDVRLTGTARLGGVVRAAVGPVEGATATLADLRGEVVGAQNTAEDGRYEFPEMFAGTYTLAVSARGYRPAALTVTVSGDGETTQDVQLTGSAELRGVVRSDSGDRALSDVRVTVVDQSGTVVAAATTGPDGRYTFLGLPEGEYTVVATGYPPVSGTVQLTRDNAGAYDVTLGHPDH